MEIIRSGNETIVFHPLTGETRTFVRRERIREREDEAFDLYEGKIPEDLSLEEAIVSRKEDLLFQKKINKHPIPFEKKEERINQEKKDLLLHTFSLFFLFSAL